MKGDSDRILKPETARLLVTPQPPGSAGLGMAVQQQNGTVYFSHSGGNPGFTCRLIASADGGRGAAVMTNSETGGAAYLELLRSIAAEYQWKDFLPPEYESIDAALLYFRRLKAESPNDPEVSEGSLNRFGYEMLQAQECESAVAVLQLNVEFYPRSANVYDSLAEAYMTGGNKEKAIELYQKALATLDEYPDENQRNARLRESIPRRLDALQR